MWYTNPIMIPREEPAMSIKKYEILLQTADLGSFTKASEVLGYTQSAISHIITGLEDELGLKLLVRDLSLIHI